MQDFQYLRNNGRWCSEKVLAQEPFHDPSAAKNVATSPIFNLGLLSPVTVKREFMKSIKSKDNMGIFPSLVSKHNQ
jgi:hypothetical protein